MDRKINIFGTIGMALAMGSWVWNLSDRVANNTREIESHREIVNVQIENIKEDRLQIAQLSAERFGEIKLQLIRIEDKVDRHSEKTHKQ